MVTKVQIDARGEQCPIPMIRTRNELEKLTEGGIVETHVDNEIAVQNLTKMAKQKGLEVFSRREADRHFIVTIRTEKGLAPESVSEQPLCCEPSGSGLVVAVGSSGMGTAMAGAADNELGGILMKGFIYAVSRLNPLPQTILFYNGGVALTTEGSACLEDLKYMAEQGVSVKTCGTCLQYYGLTDKLAVGEITNMYDIVETLAAAGSVIRP